MTTEKIFKIITEGKKNIPELEMIMEIQKLNDINFQRASNGYRLMRSSGMINKVVDKSTVGHLERLESKDGLMMVINQLDAVPTNINVGKWKPIQSKSMSEYEPNEIIPKSKMTRIEISQWLSMTDKPTDSQNYAKFKLLYD